MIGPARPGPRPRRVIITRIRRIPARARPGAALAASVLAALALVGAARPAGAAPTAARPAAAVHQDTGHDAGSGGDPGKVVIVSLPTLRWEDVAEHRPPAILDVLERAAVASMSVRAIGALTDLGEAYATVGAGNRAPADPVVAGLAFEPDDPLEWGTAGQVFERRAGESLDGAGVVHLGMPDIARQADGMRYDAKPGALGQALGDAGRRTAVVANADVPDDERRDATLAVVDRVGRVGAGRVDQELLTFDPDAAFGVRLDAEATAAAVGSAVGGSDVVVVEAGDLARTDAYRPWMTPDAYEASFERALADADELVAQVSSQLDPERDLLILMAPTAPRAPTSHQEQLTVFAMAGAGVEPGLARSGTTRRAGYVTLPDIAPTVLEHYGIELPDSMTGTAIVSEGGGQVTAGDVDDLATTNEVAMFRDRAVGPVSVVYIVLQVLVYGIAVLALLGSRPRTRWRRVAAGGSLIVLALPPVAFLSGLVPYHRLSVAGYTLALLAASAVLAAVAWAVAGRHLLGPPLALIGLSLLVQLGDVVTGGRLQINTVLGYSPVVAGRFSGFGNLSFALTAISALAVATGLWALPRLRGRTGVPVAGVGRRGWPLAVAAGLLAFTLAVDGYPSFGSDVGGVLAAGPAFAVTVLLLAGARVDLRRLAVIGVATAAVLGVFAGLDLTRPEADRTHLGRFVESAADGSATTVLARKLESNVSILTSSVWTWLMPVGLAFVAFLLWRSRGLLQRLQERVPGLRAFLVGWVLVAALGMAVNDSGVAIPAMMFGVALPYVTYLVSRTVGTAVAARPGAAGGEVGGDRGAGDGDGDGEGDGRAGDADEAGEAGEGAAPQPAATGPGAGAGGDAPARPAPSGPAASSAVR